MQHKRGDSFDLLANMPSSLGDGFFVGWDVSAQIRTLRYDKFIASLECEWVDPQTTRILRVQKISTETWALGEAIMDIQFTDPRQTPPYVISTSNLVVDITRDVTLPFVVAAP